MLNSHWKILACDLDGTLIGWNRKINDRDLDALNRAISAGIHVAICTGRNSTECAGIISILELNGLGVFANGAMVCHMSDGSTVHSTFLNKRLAADVIDFFGTAGHAVLVLTDDPTTRMPTYFLTDHAQPHAATTDWLLTNRVGATTVNDLPKSAQSRIVRLGIVVNPPEAPQLHATLQARFPGRCATHSIYSPHYDCQIIEVFHTDVNKWTGLLHLAHQMHVDPSRIITIGDDINDLAMLQGASLSFAMGDANDHVKSQAKRTTAPHADCGLADVVDQLLAGQLEPS
jgi:Cof subfamily protein (haloacid dehalogenase superfamily)